MTNTSFTIADPGGRLLLVGTVGPDAAHLPRNALVGPGIAGRKVSGAKGQEAASGSPHGTSRTATGLRIRKRPLCRAVPAHDPDLRMPHERKCRAARGESGKPIYTKIVREVHSPGPVKR